MAPFFIRETDSYFSLCFQAFCLAGLVRAMRNDKLPSNMWAGIRTKAGWVISHKTVRVC